jgi:hypothetical protein
MHHRRWDPVHGMVDDVYQRDQRAARWEAIACDVTFTPYRVQQTSLLGMMLPSCIAAATSASHCLQCPVCCCLSALAA